VILATDDETYESALGRVVVEREPRVVTYGVPVA
jgi:hypothetical protein